MQDLISLVQHYGLAIVFASAFIEQLGLPLPSYPVLLVAGALSYAGGDSLVPIVAIGALGVVMGDLLIYAIGARFGRRALSLVCKLSLARDNCVRQTEDRFAHYGPRALLFVKFVPGFALVLILLCGVARLAIPTFLLLDGTGALAYVALPVVLGGIFHDAIDSALQAITRWGEFGTVLVVVILALYFIYRLVDRQLFIRRLRMARISAPELAGLIDAGEHPIIFDVRSAEARSKEGIIPGSIGARPDEISALARQYERDAVIIVYCSCPNEASAAVAALHLKRAGFRNIRPLLGGIEAWGQAGRPIELVAMGASVTS
ncbi:DedA family protein/thiosulfate sulfurtransferase GlpE [Taklimakanibacter lacteus]|uniref:DedA family protein/thiosulfate sulfurtransferase GlpE n=1 Tax=Taklimakanibacter lacteus TaxID=2268456 RepID=UPI000E670FE8